VGYRIGQLAGLFGFVLAIGRLGRLLQTGPSEPRWNLILVAAAFLGAVTWWLLAQTTIRKWSRLAIFSLGGLLLIVRIAAPETLLAGVVPTTDTAVAMGGHLELALRIIRSGVPPVIASPGLLAILAALMWSVGALFTWGSSGGPYAAMFLPPLVVYLQFAVFDRAEAGLGWLMASSLAIALSVVSIALERREESGRARDARGRPMERRSVALAGLLAGIIGIGAILVADNASALISEYGNAPWRGGGGGGYGDGSGGPSFHRLVDLRQRVIDRSNTPVFVATFGPGAPPPSQAYWRVETLDTFNGTEWTRSDVSLTQFQPGRPLANPYDVYQGTTSDFLQVVRIQNLKTEVAPTVGVPIDIQDPPGDEGRRRPTEFQILSDSAIMAPSGLRDGDQYQVRTLAPDRTADLGILATGLDGQLTPMFRNAAEAGEFPYEPAPTDTDPVEPPDLGRYTDLPDDTPASIARLAQSVTRGATSDFERAWILQSWFRDPADDASGRSSGGFVYSTDVSTGHDALVLDEWLNDPNSVNYRTGYCEQFAAAMAVMARELDIPSRVVWGFTPGRVEQQSDGNSQIVVRDTNAHAWVELWIDPLGWVEFDPTPRGEQTGFAAQPASMTAAVNPEENLPEVQINPAEAPDLPGFVEPPEFVDSGPVSTSGGGPRWWLIGVTAAVLLVGSVPGVKYLRRRRRLTRIREGDITAVWDELVDRLIDLDQDVPDSLTPVELARRTDTSLVPVALSYASTVYGGRQGQATEADLYGAEWWIDRTFDSRTRARAALRVRSLMKRR
jgi:transglutaminase-like putative cysteine protease